MWASEEHYLMLQSSCRRKNNLQLSIEVHLSVVASLIKTTTEQPCGSGTFVAHFGRHIVRHSKGMKGRLLLCQRISPADKDEKCSFALCYRAECEKESMTLAVGNVLTQVTVSDVWCTITGHTAHLLDCVMIKRQRREMDDGRIGAHTWKRAVFSAVIS